MTSAMRPHFSSDQYRRFGAHVKPAQLRIGDFDARPLDIGNRREMVGWASCWPVRYQILKPGPGSSMKRAQHEIGPTA